MLFRTGGIASDEVLFQPPQRRFGKIGAPLEGGFAETGQSGVGFHFEKHQIAPAQSRLVDGEPGDFHFAIRRRAGKRAPRAQAHGGSQKIAP